MSIDLLDAAFLRRLDARERETAASRASRPPAVLRPERRAAARAAAVEPPAGSLAPAVAVEPRPVQAGRDAALSAALAAGDDEHEPMVERLLALAPDQWDALAGHVEAARQRGRRVIAVAGGRSGEGRTTLVRCLATTLRTRGRDVACTIPHDLAAVAAGPDGRGPTHDKRIILVDAGIWFPPGPIRRSVLQIASLGCEAAILVRRVGSSGGLARQAALEGLGIEVLGEVLTFTSARGADDGHPGGAAA